MCDSTNSSTNSVILSNEFSIILNNLNKYSRSKGHKSLLRSILNSISVSRSAVTDREMNIDKVSISMTGMI